MSAAARPLPPLLLRGDCIARMRDLPDASIDAVVTSPPYYGLRDYGHEGQGGQEETPDHYVAWLVSVFEQVARVLKPTGTAWLNLGDSYANNSKWGGSTSGKAARALHGATGVGCSRRSTGAPAKSLLGMPWRVALALQVEGWAIRSAVIWEKPNPMPEAVKDRPTKSYEHVFMLTRSTRYFYNAEAMQEPASSVERPQRKRAEQLAAEKGLTPEHFAAIKAAGLSDAGKNATMQTGTGRNADDVQRLADEAKAALGGYYREFLLSETRNSRDVWRIPTKPYRGAHFATFPIELAQRCIVASTPPGGIVLDPFAGSGTTLEAAHLEGFEAIGVELTPDYWPLIESRIERAVAARAKGGK